MPDVELLIGSAVRVAVAELNVRDRPSTAGLRIGTLRQDDIVVITGWQPYDADGSTWYEVRQALQTRDLPRLPDLLEVPSEPLSGWVAVARGATPYVARFATRCPAGIDLFSISAMLDAERLACFGSNSLVLEGVYGCGGCGGFVLGTYEPEWLAHPMDFGLLSVYPLSRNRWAAVVLRLPPEGPSAPPVGSVIRVRGHFDDDRATSCAIARPIPWDQDPDVLVPIDPASAELYCRQRYVVESYEILGTDPDFPIG